MSSTLSPLRISYHNFIFAGILANTGFAQTWAAFCLLSDLSHVQVLVLEGELIMGHVDKKTVGSSAQGLIHTSWLEKGWDVTRMFMNMVSFFE